MAELKTQKNRKSVTQFLDAIEDEQKRKDAKLIHKLIREASGEKAAMWGESIVGYGSCHLRYDSGRELDWFLVGFSPRKQNLVLYITPGFTNYDPLMKQLGKHKTGKSCLYIQKLGDVDLDVLKTLIQQSTDHMRKRYTA